MSSSDKSISSLLAAALRNEALNAATNNLKSGIQTGIGNGGQNDEADAAAASSEPFVAFTARGGLLMKAPDLRSFEEGAVAEAYILKELWMRLMGEHPRGRGISLPSSSNTNDREENGGLSLSMMMTTEDNTLSSAEIAKEIESIFNHYSLCRPGQGRSGRLLSTAAWKSFLRDCHEDNDKESNNTSANHQQQQSFDNGNGGGDNGAVRFSSRGTVPYAVADVIYTRCLRGEAARYGILHGPKLNRVQEEKGLTLETFAWALSRLALWLAPDHMRSSLGASAFGGSVGVNEGTMLSLSDPTADAQATSNNANDNLIQTKLPLSQLTSEESIDALLISLFTTLRGARRLSGIGKGADLLRPESVAVLGANAGLLRTIFLAYSMPSVSNAVAPEPHSDGCVLPFERLEKAADEFRICPRLLARSRLFAIFITVSPSRTPLLFSGFVEVMGRCALVSFGQHPLVDEFPNPEDQLDAFFARLRLSTQLQTARHELKVKGFKLTASSSASLNDDDADGQNGGVTYRTSSSISSTSSLSQARSPTAIQLLGPAGSPSAKGQRMLTAKVSLANAATAGGSRVTSVVESAWGGFGQTVSELAGSVVGSARLGLGFAVGTVIASTPAAAASEASAATSSSSRAQPPPPPPPPQTQPAASFSSITDIHKVIKTRSVGGAAAVLSPSAKISSPKVVHAVTRTFAAVSPIHSPRIINNTDASVSSSSSSPRLHQLTSSSSRTSSSLSPGRRARTTQDLLSVTTYNAAQPLFTSGGEIDKALLNETANRLVSPMKSTLLEPQQQSTSPPSSSSSSTDKSPTKNNINNTGREQSSSPSNKQQQLQEETDNHVNNKPMSTIPTLPLPSSPAPAQLLSISQQKTIEKKKEKVVSSSAASSSSSSHKRRSSSLTTHGPKPPPIDISGPIKVGQLAGKPSFKKGFVTANTASSAATSASRLPELNSTGEVFRNSGSGISQWSVIGDAPQRVHTQIQDSSFGIPVTIPVPNLAQRAAARMTASMGIAPISPNLLNSDNSKPMPPPAFNRPEGELTSQALVSFLCSEFSPLIPAIRPVFNFYARLSDPGNSGAMTHPSFISLLRDIDAIDQKVTHGQVQLQIGLTHHSAIKAYKLRSEMLQLQGVPVSTLPPPPVAGLLSEDDFLEALVRVSELVRKSQPPQKQSISSSSSSSSSTPDEIESEMRRAKLTCANFIIRRILPLVAVAEAQDEGAAALLESEEVEEEMAKHLPYLERIYARYCRQLAAAPSLSSSSAGVGLFEPQFELLARHFELTPMLIPRTEVRAAFFASARRAGTDFSLPGKTGTGVGISGTGGTSFSGLWPRQNDPATGPSTRFDESMVPPPSAAPAAFCAILGQPSIGGGKSGFGMFSPNHTTAANRKGKRVGDGRAVLTTEPVAPVGPPPSGGFINRGRQQRDPLSAYLTFPSFLECIARLALVAFSKPYLVDKHPSLAEKILGLVAWMQATKPQHGDYQNQNFKYEGEVDDVRRGTRSSSGRSLSLPRKQLIGDTNPTFEGDPLWSSSSKEGKKSSTSLVVSTTGGALTAFQRLGMIAAAASSQKNKSSSSSLSSSTLPSTSGLADVMLLHGVPRLTSVSSYAAWRGRNNNNNDKSASNNRYPTKSKRFVPFNALARRALEDVGLFDLLGEEYGLEGNDDEEEEENEQEGGGVSSKHQEILLHQLNGQHQGDEDALLPPPPPPAGAGARQTSEEEERGRKAVSTKSQGLSRSTNVRSASEIPSTAASRAAAAMGNFFAAQTVPPISTYWLPPPIDASLIIDGATTAPSSVNTSGATSGRRNDRVLSNISEVGRGPVEYDAEKHTLFGSSSTSDGNVLTTMDLLIPPPPPPSPPPPPATTSTTTATSTTNATPVDVKSNSSANKATTDSTQTNVLDGSGGPFPKYRSDVSVFHRGETAFYARIMAGRAASMVKNAGVMFRAGLQVGIYDALDSARLSTYDTKLKTSDISSFKEPVSNGRVIAQEGVSLKAIEKIVAPEAGVVVEDDEDGVGADNKDDADENGDENEDADLGGKLHVNTVTPVMLSKFTDGNPLVAGKRPAGVALKQRESAVNVLRKEFLLRPVTSPHSRRKQKPVKNKGASTSSAAAIKREKVPTLEEIAMEQYEDTRNRNYQDGNDDSSCVVGDKGAAQNGLTMEDLVNSTVNPSSSLPAQAGATSSKPEGVNVNTVESGTTAKPQLQNVTSGGNGGSLSSSPLHLLSGGGRASPSTSLSQPLTGELLKNYDNSLRLSVFDNSTPAERKAISEAALRTGRPSPTSGGMRQGTNSTSTLVQWDFTSSIGTGATLPGELPIFSSSSINSNHTGTVAMMVPFSHSGSSSSFSNSNKSTTEPHFLLPTESRENALIASVVAKPALSSILFKSSASASTPSGLTRRAQTTSHSSSSSSGPGLTLLSQALNNSASGSSSQVLASSKQTPRVPSTDDMTSMISAGDQLALKREEVKKLYAASPSTGRPSIGPGSKGFSIKRNDAWSSVSSENLRDLWDSVAPAAGKTITPSAKPAFIAATRKAVATETNVDSSSSSRVQQQRQQDSRLSSSSSSSSMQKTLDLERLSPTSIVKSVFPDFVTAANPPPPLKNNNNLKDDPEMIKLIQKSLSEATAILSLSGRTAPEGVTSVSALKKLATDEQEDKNKDMSQRTSSEPSSSSTSANPNTANASSSLSSSALFQLAYGAGGTGEEENGSESYEIS
jgi:hypothetical protein